MPRQLVRSFNANNSCLLFNGNTAFVDFPAISAYNFTATGKLSFVTWFKLVRSTHSTQNFIKKANVGTSGYKIFYDGTNKYFKIEEESAAFTQANSSSPSPDIDFVNWHHFAFTFDAAAQAVKFYLDSVLLTTTDNLTYSGITSDTASDVKIGGDGGASASFSGFMAETLLFNTVLAQSDITLGFTTSIWPTAGRQLYAKYGENTGTTTVDSQNPSNSGTLTNSPSWSVNTPFATRTLVT